MLRYFSASAWSCAEETPAKDTRIKINLLICSDYRVGGHQGAREAHRGMRGWGLGYPWL
jgi:hypothetical protein